MDRLLENINSPVDLKGLDFAQLGQLSDEIRDFIIDKVSVTGGHLGSNLGIVELTLALHYVFDLVKDDIVFDVGHQCYAHKIITGRRDRFGTLRSEDGLSGFPNPGESEYDKFSVGHAGTAIATAIGLALGKQQQNKDDEKIVAIVGDASIVNGVSFEGLNNLGLVKRQMMIVLNDNSMAIDPTQGAVAKYFSKIRLSQTYEDMRKTANNIMDHLPVVGKGMENAVERIKKAIRMVLPASQLFESLNIPYFGPVYGHDIESMVHLFGEMKKLDRPAILHVFTGKGKGFEPAEKAHHKFHSTGPFSINGDIIEPVKGEGRSYTQAMGDGLVELAEKDEKIVAITCAMCDGTGLRKFKERFPGRFYDVGIAESAAVDIAAGLAKEGLKPVVCIYSTFLQRSFDQIFQEVSLQGLPVVFCIDRAGLVGADGPTHHGLLDIDFMRCFDGIELIGPGCGMEVKGALEYAVNCGNAVAIRYPKDIIHDDVFEMDVCGEKFEAGKSVTVHEGIDPECYIVNYGSLLGECLNAAKKLSEQGLETDVINARFAEPFDNRIIELCARGKNVVTVEDHSICGGFGSGLLEALNVGGIMGKVKVLGVARGYVKHSSRKRQLMKCGLDADNICLEVRKLCGKDLED